MVQYRRMEYTLQRKKRKTLSMRLNGDGSLTVFAPLSCPRDTVDRFVQKHTGWVERKRASLPSAARQGHYGTQEGKIVLWFGEEYAVRLWEKGIAVFEKGVAYLPEKEPLSALRRAYARELKKYLSAVLAVYEERTGFIPSGVKVTSAKSRWGSCSGKNALCFSRFLAVCGKSCIDYVVVHELCHIPHKNHSRAFWEEVEKHCPDYRQERRALKKYACFLETLQ